MSDLMDRIRAGAEAFERARMERASFWPAMDVALSAAEQKAREQAAQREWDEQRAASRAEIEQSCRRFGWWWR